MNKDSKYNKMKKKKELATLSEVHLSYMRLRVYMYKVLCKVC